MTHDEAFAALQARKRAEEAATVKVTWRKVSPITGGGYSGLGPNRQLVYVYPLDPNTSAYNYGRVQEVEPGIVHRTVEGNAPTLAQAKTEAAKLIGATS